MTNLASALLKGLVFGAIAGLALGFAFGLIPLSWNSHGSSLRIISALNLTNSPADAKSKLE
jgi:hypothetical protein